MIEQREMGVLPFEHLSPIIPKLGALGSEPSRAGEESSVIHHVLFLFTNERRGTAQQEPLARSDLAHTENKTDQNSNAPFLEGRGLGGAEQS